MTAAPIPGRDRHPAGPLPAAPWPRAFDDAAARLRSLVRRLPVQPPSLLAALALDRLLLPRLDATQRRELSQRAVEVEVVEAGLRVRLVLRDGGFAVARGHEPPILTIRARADALWRLLRGEDDPDRLFFDRALVMEGDTEFGLVLKNTLDAVGPVLPRPPWARR